MSTRFGDVLAYLEHRHGGALRESTPRRLVHASIHRELVRQTRLPLVLIHLVSQYLVDSAERRHRLISCHNMRSGIDSGDDGDSKRVATLPPGKDRVAFEARATRHVEMLQQARTPDGTPNERLAYGDRFLMDLTHLDAQQRRYDDAARPTAIWNGCSAMLIRGTAVGELCTGTSGDATVDDTVDDTWRLDFPSGHWFECGWLYASRAEIIDAHNASKAATFDLRVSLLATPSVSASSSTATWHHTTVPRIEKPGKRKETPSGSVLSLAHLSRSQSFTIHPRLYEFTCEPVDGADLLSTASASASPTVAWRMWRLTRHPDDACTDVDPSDEVYHVFALRDAQLDAASLRVFPCNLYEHAQAVLGVSVAWFPLVAATHNLNPHRTFFQDTETAVVAATWF
jgi:hypothetical protein